MGFGSFGTLEARDINSNSVLWSFAGDGQLQSAVLVVNDHVYVGSAQGRLYAVDAATGQQVWLTTAGASIPFVDEQKVSQPLTSFAAAEGLLVVPTSTTLVAYESDPGDTQPSGAVTVQPNGSYSFTLSLPATSPPADKDGHLYTIVVNGSDRAGNSRSATTTLRIN